MRIVSAVSNNRLPVKKRPKTTLMPIMKQFFWKSVAGIGISILVLLTLACTGQQHNPNGQTASEDELLKELKQLPLEIAWPYKSSLGKIHHITIGSDHLYIEADNKLMAQNRHEGFMDWVYNLDAHLSWQPVESHGTVGLIKDLEARIRKVVETMEDERRKKEPDNQLLLKLKQEERELAERIRLENTRDNLYFITKGRIYCIQRRPPARELWSRRLDFIPNSKPFVSKDNIFIAAGNYSRVYMLNAENKGEEVTNFSTSVEKENQITNTPFFEDPNLYFVSHDGSIYSYHVQRHEFSWKPFKTLRPLKADPVVHRYEVKEGAVKGKYILLLFGGMDEAFYALDAVNGHLIWKYNTEGPIKSAPIVMGKTVYVKSEHALLALDLLPLHLDKEGNPASISRVGRLLWKVPAGKAPLIKIQDTVYILGSDNRILAVEESTGRIINEYKLPHFNFFLTNTMDETLYLANSDGYIFALKKATERLE